MGGRGALPEIGLGRPVAADWVAVEHALPALRLPAGPRRSGERLQVPIKAEDSILSVLDPVLCSFAPLEFPHGPLERRRAF